MSLNVKLKKNLTKTIALTLNYKINNQTQTKKTYFFVNFFVLFIVFSFNSDKSLLMDSECLLFEYKDCLHFKMCLY